MLLYNSPLLAVEMKTKKSNFIQHLLILGTYRTYLWMHCVWLGLINTYNVVGNQASQACVIIAFWLAMLDKDFASEVFYMCVKERRRPTLYAIMLKHMDRQVLCHYCKGMFDMVWCRAPDKHKSTILLTWRQTCHSVKAASVPERVCMNLFELVSTRSADHC